MFAYTVYPRRMTEVAMKNRELHKRPEREPRQLEHLRDTTSSAIFASVKCSSTRRFGEGNPLRRREASSLLHRFAPKRQEGTDSKLRRAVNPPGWS